jgi:hypothetical protein
MAVSATATVVSYTGNGSTTSLAVTFPFQGTGSSAELEVVQRTIATGAEAVLSYTTHYTVTGGSGSTGTVVMASAPADTVQIHIRRTTTRTQTVDYTANDPFPADTHELALDRLAMGMHEIQEELDRSFKVSRTNAITTPEFVDNASTRASKLLGFSSDGNTLEATTGRVNSVSVSNVAVNGAGASQAATVSYTDSTGALALGIPVGSTGATGATGAAGDLTDPTTTQHDIIVRGASAVERLAKGSNSTVLNTNASGALAYSTVSTAMIADDAVTAAKVASNAVVEASIADNAVTLAKMASGTDGNLITYDASGNPANVATGSAGQVLTSAGAGSPPAFAAASAGSLVHITTVTASSSATVDINSTLTDTYKVYMVTFENLAPATNNVELQMLVSTDNGSSYVTSNYQYVYKSFYAGPSGDGNTESTGNSYLSLAPACSNTAADGGTCGNMFITSPTASGFRTAFTWDFVTKMGDGSNFHQRTVGGAFAGATADNDAIQFKFASGNAASGSVRVYGISNS